jgi:hypothetical protein
MGKVLCYLLIPPLICFTLWIAVVHSFGAVATEVFGMESERLIAATKQPDKAKRRRRNCRYQIYSDAMQRAYPSHLCVESWQYTQYPERFELVLIGKETYFGFNIHSHHIR